MTLAVFTSLYECDALGEAAFRLERTRGLAERPRSGGAGVRECGAPPRCARLVPAAASRMGREPPVNKDGAAVAAVAVADPAAKLEELYRVGSVSACPLA